MYFEIMYKDIKYKVEIDDEDQERVLCHTWHISILKGTHTPIYVYTSINKKTTSLKNFISGIYNRKEGETSHKDHNGLNNKKDNLIRFDRAENSRLIGARRRARALLKPKKEVLKVIKNIKEIDQDTLEIEYISKKKQMFLIYIDKLDYYLIDNKSISINKGRNTYYIKVYENHKIYNLHRLILGDPPEGYSIDHIDRNGLNNTRKNLRVVPYDINVHNRNIFGKVGYKGVAYDKKRKKYSSIVVKDRIRYFLGLFSDPIVAALAYDLGSKIVYKEQVTINGVRASQEMLDIIKDYKYTRIKSKTGRYLRGSVLFDGIDLDQLYKTDIGQKIIKFP